MTSADEQQIDQPLAQQELGDQADQQPSDGGAEDQPEVLPGLNPAWDRYVEAVDADGVTQKWHLLERPAAAGRPTGTLLCVHGNPTWSYLWRRVLAEAPADWRVVAVDQLGMGWSSHPGGDLEHPRTLAQRLDDLDGITDVLGIGTPDGGPVVVAGHDWGGVVVSGWAQRHADSVVGVVLANTAVHHDFGAGLPKALRVARHPQLLHAATVRSPAFVYGATLVSRPLPPAEVRAAYAMPYRGTDERSWVGQFVADIPLEADHPTRPVFEAIADGMSVLADRPALLLRGPLDPVFSEEHLRDLQRRLPLAEVIRYPGASHLVLEDAPRSATDIWNWVAAKVVPALAGSTESADVAPAPWSGRGRPEVPPTAVGTQQVPWQGLLDAAERTPDAPCVTEMRSGRSVSFAELEADIARVAAAFAATGMRPGDRVALLVPPGIDLTVAVYAAWRVGAVIVVADAGLGLKQLGGCLRGAGLDHIVSIPAGLAACAALGVPGRRILVGDLPDAARKALRVEHSLDDLRALDAPPVGVSIGHSSDAEIDADPECAVLFTSGATGPSKGVVYRVSALRTMIGHVGQIYALQPGDVLVAAFAPFALYGPALGIGAVTPDMDVTAPGTLTAAALADAIRAAKATVVFASPAALRNVLRTADALTSPQREALAQVRDVMSAGAPVPAELLRALGPIMPKATAHTPYGMTEVLPVSDITLPEIDAAYADDDGSGAGGVCVGRPLPGVELAISPLPTSPDQADGELTTTPGVTGEIVVRAAHVKDRYDQLWATTHSSTPEPGVHRTGDVGHLDEAGRLWVEGRRVHVVHSAAGPVTPVALEQAAGGIEGVASATVVGVGPVGTQQIVVVLVLERAYARVARRLRGLGRTAPVLAPPSLAALVRDAGRSVGVEVSAVLLTSEVPVDIRHQSKVDRTRVARWAEGVLAGGRPGRKARP